MSMSVLTSANLSQCLLFRLSLSVRLSHSIPVQTNLDTLVIMIGKIPGTLYEPERVWEKLYLFTVSSKRAPAKITLLE